MSLAGKRVLLIVAGGIAAFKVPELIRLLRGEGCAVRCVLTAGGAQFVTPLTLQALTEDRVYTDLFSLTDESEMGHIQLSRGADLVVVAPATADLLARMAAGLADDLAATVLLATDKPVLVAPAMNVRMWLHPATVANIATLQARGVRVIGPDEGAMACNEVRAGPHVRAAGDPRAPSGRCWPGRRPGRSPAGTCWSPAARPTSRSTRCATSPTAAAGGRAMRSPRRWRRWARG